MKTEIKFNGFRRDTKWPHYAWLLIINGESFDFKTGTGHATPYYKSNYERSWGHRNKKPVGIQVINDSESESWVEVPKADEILDCLFSDEEHGSQNFHDFCDNLGFSSDSLAALDTYRDCMEAGKKFRKAIGAEYANEKERIQKLREEGKL